MNFSYFVNQDTLVNNNYIVVPKALLKGDAFKGMSADAKLAYVLFLDRLSLSKKNNWIDEKGKFYIIYSVEEIVNDLGSSKVTVSKILNSLEHEFGLIERFRRGLGLPNLIYVKDFANKIDDIQNTINSLKYENFTSEDIGEENLQPEVKNLYSEVKNLTPKTAENLQPEVKNLYSEVKNLTPKTAENLQPEVKNLSRMNLENLCVQGKKNDTLKNKPYMNNTYMNNISSSSMINDYNIGSSNIDIDDDDDDDDKIDKINLFSYFNFSNFSTKDQEKTKNIIQLLEEIMSEDKSKAIEISNFDGYSYSDVQNHILKFKKTDLLNISKKLSSYKKPIGNLKAFLLSLLLNYSTIFSDFSFQNSENYQEKEIINTKVHMIDPDEFLKE